ncbi:MAG: hypothetical protein HPY66_2949 [Firmicutes bacterium]|nr:hypothetical protein [Bacillota bacterium]
MPDGFEIAEYDSSFIKRFSAKICAKAASLVRPVSCKKQYPVNTDKNKWYRITIKNISTL